MDDVIVAGGGPTGALRLKIKPRDAQVYVDGYYAGQIDEFDGIFRAGAHVRECVGRFRVRADVAIEMVDERGGIRQRGGVSRHDIIRKRSRHCNFIPAPDAHPFQQLAGRRIAQRAAAVAHGEDDGDPRIAHACRRRVAVASLAVHVPDALESTSTDPNAPEYKCILDLMNAVDDYIPTPERPLDKPFLMPVEDVFGIKGRGTVVTGRIERGIVKVGDEIEIVGIKPTLKTTCTGVEMFRKLLDQGHEFTRAIGLVTLPQKPPLEQTLSVQLPLFSWK